MGFVLFSMFLMFWFGWFLVLSKRKWSLTGRAEKYKCDAKRFVAKGPLYKSWRIVLHNRNMSRREGELSDCLAYVKNIVILGRGQSMSAQLLLEELADMSNLLTPTFLDMAHFIHICENQRAEQIFCSAFDSDLSKDIAKLFVEWENIPSEKLLGTIAAYRSVLVQNRQSNQKRKDEIVSDIIYLPVVINAMAVLLNFIYVAYFLEQRQALMSIF